jgi:hypothetical protein
MKPSSWRICRAKNRQKRTGGEKIMTPEISRIVFTKNSGSNISQPISKPLKKSLNITLLRLEVQDDL